jgi:hypothetical protein
LHLKPIVPQWNPEHYSRNSSAQEKWASELLAGLLLKGHEQQERTWIQDHLDGPGKLALVAEVAGALIGSLPGN